MLALTACRPAAPGAFTAARRPQERRGLRVACSAQRAGVDRRAALAAAAAAAASQLLAGAPAWANETRTATKTIRVSSLTAFQKADMLADTMARASAELAKVVGAADQAAALRLLVNDAGTYDAADPGSAGGVDGSVVLPEELGRPENAGLKPLVERLAKAKAAIDAQQAARGAAPFSWADTIALAAKVTTEAGWVQQRQARASTPEGKKNALMFSNPIPLRIGRVDAAAPAPAGRLPPRGAAAAEVKAFFSKLGVKPGADEGPFAKKPPFSERVHFLLWSAAQEDQAAAEAALVEADPGAYADWKKKYDISRRTVTRTDYEVDFGEKLSLLADLGATFDKKAYLYPLTFALPVKL